MANYFVVGRDGFIQYENHLTFEQAKERRMDYIKNKLYQYDVAIYEVSETGETVRRVEYAELHS